MRKTLTIFLLALGLAGAVSYGYCLFRRHGRGNESPNETLSVQSFKLSNGLVAELVAGDCDNSAALVILFSIGANHDPPGRSGMTHLIERVLSVPAPGRAKRTVTSGSDHVLYSIVTSGDELLREIDALAARMSRLELSDVDFQTAQKQVLVEVENRGGGDASLTAMTYAAESIQPSRGNGRRGGIAAEVRGIDRAAVEKFWRQQFTPVNTRIVVLGRMDREKVRARIKQAFASLPGGTPPTLRPPGESTVIGTLVIGDAPASVAVAVPAPMPSDQVYPAFLVLTARLMGQPSGSRAWAASYDPLARPETLFVTGAVQAGEGAEPAAARIRADVTKLLAQPLTPADISAARERFGLFLGLHELDPKTCRSDPLGLAIARARRAQLGLEKLKLAQALEATSQAHLAEAVGFLDPRRTTAVIAGGAIR